MQDRLKNKKIIITGASSGIGEKVAWHIALEGGIPILLARSMNKLENIQDKIKEELQIHSYVYPVDMLNDQQLNRTFETILSEHDTIHGLINNAGMGVFEYANDIQWEDVEGMLKLNVHALIRSTKVMLPHLLTTNNGHSHIVNIGSQAGKIATPKSSIYSASKYAVVGFTNALRLELRKEKIFVTAVNLGPVNTDFFKNADPDGTYQQSVGRIMLDPEFVAKKIVSNLFKNKREINLPWWMDVGSKMYNLFPSLFETLLQKQFNKK